MLYKLFWCCNPGHVVAAVAKFVTSFAAVVVVAAPEGLRRSRSFYFLYFPEENLPLTPPFGPGPIRPQK